VAQLPKPVIGRSVILRVPYGSRELRVCETQLIDAGETVMEIVDYNPSAPEGRDAYGAGAVIPMADGRAVLEAMDTILTRRGL
jgi:hypothetical protein